MQNFWQTEQQTAQRQRELLAEARQYRLIRQNRPAARTRILRIYGPAMYRVGLWLSAWGAQLQAEYHERAAGVRPERLELSSD